MKNLLIVPLFLLVLSSCDELDKLTHFEMDYDTSVVIPSSAGVDLPFDVYSPEMETDSESEFSVNDTRKDLIEEIVLREFELELTAPEDRSFAFLNSIEIFVRAKGDEEEVLMAWLYDIPEDIGDKLVLHTGDSDLQEYIKQDSFTLRLHTKTDAILTSDHQVDVHAVFFVDANILGL